MKRFLKTPAAFVTLFLLASFPALAQSSPAADLDRDGVPDDLEQGLLEKFRPAFMISASDCDGRPAEFVPGRSKAVVLEHNGTIYGQVFQPQPPGPATRMNGAVLEIHYYDLWARDCGRMSHKLDPEHVAVLVYAPSLASGPAEWQAAWWYAGAHEHTVCDRSTLAAASAIGASDRGATFWISAGKHAAFLSSETCGGGCGEDRCRDAIALPAGKLVNLGELQAPLNGADWTASRQWHLSEKMRSSFPPQVWTAENWPASGDALIPASAPNPSLQSVILAGGSSLDALGTGGHETSMAVSVGAAKTGHALGASNGKVQGSLRTAARKTWNWISGKTATSSDK